MNPISLSIIIVNYNVKDYILKAIESAYNYIENINFEIIVVDNCSVDDSIISIKKLFKNVIIIENKENKGFSAANNQGIEMSNGDYIMLMNPDAEVKKKSFNSLFEFVEKSNKDDIVGPYLENTDGSFQKSFWKTPTLWNICEEVLFINYLKGNDGKNIANKPFNVECISGALMIFHKNIISKIGGLDPNLFWMDDTDFCFRIRKNGGNVLYYPESHFIHHVGKSSSKNQKVAISNQIISKIKFFRKHKLHISFYLSIVLSYILILEKIILFSLLSFYPKARTKLSPYIFTASQLSKYLFCKKEKVS